MSTPLQAPMKATVPMASPQRLAPPTAEPSLDERIALAELAVIRRDARIRLRTDRLVTRVRREAVKQAGVGLLLGAGAIVLTWGLNRLARRHAPSPESAAAEAPEPTSSFEDLFREAGAVLAGLLPVLWPLLPRGWRNRLTPGTAGTLLSFLLPLLGRLFRRRPAPPPAP